MLFVVEAFFIDEKFDRDWLVLFIFIYFNRFIVSIKRHI